MDRLKQVYNRVAKYYDRLDRPFEQNYYQSMRKATLTQIRDSRILEIGIGTGKNLPYYHHSNSVLGIDQSENMLLQAKSRFHKLKSVRSDLAEVQFDVIPDLSAISSYKFDIIVASFVIYLQDDPETMLSQLSGLLEDKGKLIILEYKVPSTQRSRVIAKLLTVMTKPLYGLNFNNIQTIKLLQRQFTIIDYTEYGHKWMYALISEKTEKYS